MALIHTHRQVVCRLLPQTRSNRHWLETTLEARRQLCNAALEERIDFRLRARGTCRHQRGKEHPVRGAWPRPGTRGVRDWRVCTARGVRAADLTDP